ncbi:MAG: peptidase C39 family protein [Nitrososphaerota archaeon]|nr:peptidase C39 family protein [Nitrososphaerota archaeon]
MIVPFYKQHYEFTCGPASLMMAMKYFQKDLKVGRELEMDIWREATMLESYGTSRYGLAFSAAKRGFRVEIYSNIKGAGFVKKIEPFIGKVNQAMLGFFLQDRRRRAIGLGVKEKFVHKITEEILCKTLRSGSIPLLLSNAEYFGAEDIPHWIIVSGFDKEAFYAINPLQNGQKKLLLSSFDRVIGYKGDQCMVAVAKGKPKASNS